jgi:hypothetical protein
MIRCIVSLFISLAAASQLGCGLQQTEPSVKMDGTAAPTVIQTPRRNSKIPIEVSYPIVRDDQEYNTLSKKRLIEVKLNMKVSKDVLGEIALEVKSQETRQYERTFISYYLPEYVPNARREPWAISHFNPTLQVEILGLDKEAEKFLKGQPITRGDELIGSWIIDTRFSGRRVTIYREKTLIKMEELFIADNAAALAEQGHKNLGVRDESILTEVPSKTGRWFKVSGSDNPHEIDSNGVLRIYGDENKIIHAALPMM